MVDTKCKQRTEVILQEQTLALIVAFIAVTICSVAALVMQHLWLRARSKLRALQNDLKELESNSTVSISTPKNRGDVSHDPISTTTYRNR